LILGPPFLSREIDGGGHSILPSLLSTLGPFVAMVHLSSERRLRSFSIFPFPHSISQRVLFLALFFFFGSSSVAWRFHTALTTDKFRCVPKLLSRETLASLGRSLVWRTVCPCSPVLPVSRNAYTAFAVLPLCFFCLPS